MGVEAVLDLPAEGRNAAVHGAAVENFERAHRGDFVGQVLRRFVAGGMDLSIAFSAQAQEVVVLADDLAAGP